MDPLDLNPGSKVFHALFGTGTVRAVSGSGPSAKITVNFGAAVGDKTLLAAAAPLQPAAEGSTAEQHWCEVLTVECSLRRGSPLPAPNTVRDAIHARASNPAFWVTVREALRAGQGSAPRVLDAPSGCVSLSVRERYAFEIRIKHAEPLRPAQLVLARAIFEVLLQQGLKDFERFGFRTELVPGGALVETDIIAVNDEGLPQLADRAPRRRPLPVRPKGVIPNMPRRRDDY